MSERPAVIARWHEIIETSDLTGLAALLADDAVFRSPAVHTPQEGKAKTFAYLAAAFDVLGPELEYVDEWIRDSSAILEFATVVDGLQVRGIDRIEWNEDGQITDFTVYVRPRKALDAVIGKMAEALQNPASVPA